MEGFVAAATANFDTQALDFLVERRKGNDKTFRGFGLVPVRAFEHVHDDAALNLVHDLKQRRLWAIRRRPGARLAGKRGKKFRKLQAHATHDLLAANSLRQ